MTPQTSLSDRAWAELCLLALIWGASFIAIRTALDQYGPFTVVALRVAPAAAALWLWVALRRLPVPNSPRLWLALLAMGLLNNTVPFTLMAWGQQHIATGLTAILNAATAIWGVLVAALVFSDERLSPRRALGVGLGFAGVATAIGWQALARFDPGALPQLAVLGGTLSYALAGAWARATLPGLRPEVAAAGMLSGACLASVPLAMLLEGMPRAVPTPATALAVGYYALIATAGAYLLYYRILARAGSGNLMLVTLLIPPVAIALGAALRGEALGGQAWTGFALLAAGLAVLDGRLLRAYRGGRV